MAWATHTLARHFIPSSRARCAFDISYIFRVLFLIYYCLLPVREFFLFIVYALLYYFFSLCFTNNKNAMNAKKQTHTHTHTLGAKRVYLVCEKKKWNKMTGSKTRISSRHSLDGTCIFCSMHDFWVWFLIVPNNTNSNQQIWLNWTVGYCSLFHRCCFFHSLVLFNHRLKTKYDRKYDLNER